MLKLLDSVHQKTSIMEAEAEVEIEVATAEEEETEVVVVATTTKVEVEAATNLMDIAMIPISNKITNQAEVVEEVTNQEVVVDMVVAEATVVVAITTINNSNINKMISEINDADCYLVCCGCN